MLDYGQCPEAIELQFENAVGIIERSGPLRRGISWKICIGNVKQNTKMG